MIGLGTAAACSALLLLHASRVDKGAWGKRRGGGEGNRERVDRGSEDGGQEERGGRTGEGQGQVQAGTAECAARLPLLAPGAIRPARLPSCPWCYPTRSRSQCPQARKRLSCQGAYPPAKAPILLPRRAPLVFPLTALTMSLSLSLRARGPRATRTPSGPPSTSGNPPAAPPYPSPCRTPVRVAPVRVAPVRVTLPHRTRIISRHYSAHAASPFLPHMPM